MQVQVRQRGDATRRELAGRALIKVVARGSLPSYWTIRRRVRRLSGSSLRHSVAFYCPEPFHYHHVEPVVRELASDARYDVSVVVWPEFQPEPVPGVRLENIEKPTLRRVLAPVDLAILTEFRALPWWFGVNQSVYFLHGIGPKVSYFASDRLKAFDAVFAPGPYVAEKQRQVMGESAEILPVGLPALDRIVARWGQVGRRCAEDKRARPLLLYAPSWSKDPARVSTSPEVLRALADQGKCDVIIRPHPLLMDSKRVRMPAWRHALEEVVGSCSHVRLHHGPDTSIYSVLAKADILMSDISSVLYEYLVLDRPVLLFARREHFDFYEGSDILEATRRACYCLEDPSRLGSILDRALAHPDELSAARKALLDRVLYFPGEAVPAMVSAIETCVERPR